MHIYITVSLLDIDIIMGTSQHYLSLIVPRLAILRRHCPEPAAPAGVEWWTLCLAARMAQFDQHCPAKSR